MNRKKFKYLEWKIHTKKEEISRFVKVKKNEARLSVIVILKSNINYKVLLSYVFLAVPISSKELIWFAI